MEKRKEMIALMRMSTESLGAWGKSIQDSLISETPKRQQNEAMEFQTNKSSRGRIK